MSERVRLWLAALQERLWLRPLLVCVASVLLALAAKQADRWELPVELPGVTADTVEVLLTVLSNTMLVIATFAVGSMVSSYASASNTATPRAFSLVVADDRSQNALSSFIGAFIFSIVALVAFKNDAYGEAGRFALFVLTMAVFAGVILTFLGWMDTIARLGRLTTAIDKVEHATAAALAESRRRPHRGGLAPPASPATGRPVRGHEVGYLQAIDVAGLQAWAQRAQAQVRVMALPGTFVTPDLVLARVTADDRTNDSATDALDLDAHDLDDAFVVGRRRTFSEDPRFGLEVLAEIAARALSPAVNDPGTAIDVVGAQVRLLSLWARGADTNAWEAPQHDRVAVPAISPDDLLDDAFTAIARDGAGTLEVAKRLQEALRSLAVVDAPGLQGAAIRHAGLALARARAALSLPADLAEVELACLVDEED